MYYGIESEYGPIQSVEDAVKRIKNWTAGKDDLGEWWVDRSDSAATKALPKEVEYLDRAQRRILDGG